VLTMDTKCPNEVFYDRLVLNRGWKRNYLQIMIFHNVCSTWGIVELKTRYKTWITRNDVNRLNLFHISYLITHMAFRRSQWTPNVQIKYFMFDWSMYRLFVLKTGFKLDSLQMMIFVDVCSTWSIVQLKTRFETWITLNEVKCVCFTFLT
jgi:hypothetical protein